MLPVGVALAVAYAVGARRVRRPWPVVRTLAFLAGCAALGASGFVSGSGFTGHMTEHVLLGMVAPVLLVSGRPITLALQATGGAALRRLLRSRVVRVVTNPIVAWAGFGGTLVALVFTPLLEWSASNDAVHGAVHLHVLVVGFVFAATLLAVDPIPHPLPHGGRLLAVLAAVPFHAFVGVALLSSRTPLFPDTYPSLDDQRTAAAVLWTSGELLTLAVACIVYADWWASEHRLAARLDRRLA